MEGPDDLPPVTAGETYVSLGRQCATWKCPRCGAPNVCHASQGGEIPTICRNCFGATRLQVSATNELPAVELPKPVWVTVLTCGARIEVDGPKGKGSSYTVQYDGREFGAYDSAWSRQDAYEVALRAVRSRRKRA